MQEAKKVDHMTVLVTDGGSLTRGTFAFHDPDTTLQVGQTVFSQVKPIFEGLAKGKTTLKVSEKGVSEKSLVHEYAFEPGFYIICGVAPGPNSARLARQRVATIPVLDENGKLVKSADELMKDLDAVWFIQPVGEGFKPGKGTGIAVAAVLFAVLALRSALLLEAKTFWLKR